MIYNTQIRTLVFIYYNKYLEKQVLCQKSFTEEYDEAQGG